MRKIPTLYLRDPEDMSRVTDVVNPECKWVLAGEGTPTRKWDGTCVMLDVTGSWWARREIKPGRLEPDGFVLAEHDEITGKTQGWVPAESSGFWKFLEEAIEDSREEITHPFEDYIMPGTFELIGPRINGNPENRQLHTLKRHGAFPIDWGYANENGMGSPQELITLCARKGWEGIVWHHQDGRMAKLKVKDFKENR